MQQLFKLALGQCLEGKYMGLTFDTNTLLAQRTPGGSPIAACAGGLFGAPLASLSESAVALYVGMAHVEVRASQPVCT